MIAWLAAGNCPLAQPSHQPHHDDRLRLADDALDRLLAGRDVGDEAHAGAGQPDAVPRFRTALEAWLLPGAA
jgi:hypothetical protein